MTVFYDHQAFSLQDFGGITRIFTELIKASKKKGFEAHLSLLYTKNRHLLEAGLQPNSVFNYFGLFRKRKIIYTINDLYNQYDIKKNKFDIYHPTYYNPKLIKNIKGAPVVATFHDMIHEKLSGRFSELIDKELTAQKKSLIRQATHVIAVSENTKKDLIDIYNIEPSKITVIHLGSSFSTQERVTKNESKPYLLFIGNRFAYKNFIPLIEAIALLLKTYNVSLVCAGGKDFSNEEKEILRRLNISDLVIQKSITDQTLPDLYANAIAFIFPSLYEGFGIPVLEAFSCNCPCILSNTSSLPEVGKDAAVYFDPYDTESIRNAVEKVINDDAFRKNMIIKGQIRLKDFSWDKHVNKTMDIYRQLSK